MRLFAALLAPTAALVLSHPAAAQARDWRGDVAQGADGAFRIGNPAAKVKLVEYLSYTCSHCAHFVEEAKVPLYDDLVRRGQVQVEVRHAVRDPLDMAAAMLARCAGPKGFSGATHAIFAAQSTWLNQGIQWWQANAAQVQAMPELARLKAVAKGSGLSALMQGRGMTPARINQCFAAAGDMNRLTAMAKSAWASIQGTPSFLINGKAVGGGHWEDLEPQLRAAGAK